jgi:predicted dehydrogenase
MSRRISRRRFLSQTASTGAAVAAVGYFSERSVAESKSPNEKLDLGVIGVGGRGASNLGNVAGENIVALSDVDSRQLDKQKQRFPNARTHADFRRLIDAGKLDGVVVSTTDHSHAPAALRAMLSGMHVYCEKPLAHTVEEAALMRQVYLANKDKLATQMGTQIHATDNYRRVVELIQSGAIGRVKEAHVWCNRLSRQTPVPKGEAPVPKWLSWDLWLDAAPYRPYQEGYLPGNLTWNRYWDIGNGIIGDMGSHLIDLPYWALDLQFPRTAHAEAPAPHPAIYPDRLIVRWEHAARGKGPHQQDCVVTWYDGHSKPNELLGVDLSRYGIGVLFVGDNGMLLADYGRRTLLPKEKFADFKAPAPTIPDSRGHHAEWIHACKTDPTTTLCNFDYSARLIEHNLLGAVSHRVGNKKLEWSHDSLAATNLPAASQYIQKKYRAGWELPVKKTAT